MLDNQDEIVADQEPLEEFKPADETEPSIEMSEDLKEPGDIDSGTEINTSGDGVNGVENGGVQQEQAEHQHEKTEPESVEPDFSIQQTAEEAQEAVASGCDSRPVENATLSDSSVLNREIQQENIKHALHEIISEIDREMEADLSNEEVSPSPVPVRMSVSLFRVRSVSISISV